MSYEIITPDKKNLYLNIHIEDTLENRKLCWNFIKKLKDDSQSLNKESQE